MPVFLTAIFFSVIGLAFIPVLRKSLHPLEILACWLLLASLEQFAYAILSVNLHFVEVSGNHFKFYAVKLEQLVLAPVIILCGSSVFFSKLRISLLKAAGPAVSVVVLWGMQYLYHLSETIHFIKWTWGQDIIKNTALAAMSLAFLALFRYFLRRKGVFRDFISSGSL
ncbi:hypothetical protein [Paenibacillus alkalitolerans]|uniref:hypothetical protein n=1 Tax=Paenibacillus alkalitolerans TaxID=2799335 RepID=UPI0018F413DD|nr:hypothetical protein [Paenibacillus alkalitolerans]